MFNNSMKSSRIISKKVKISFGVLLIIILIISIPFLLDMFIFGNKYPSHISNGEWSGFFGSYLGGIIGGGATLTAIYFTTIETRRIERDNQKAAGLKENALQRGYLIADEIDNLGLKLEGYIFNGDTRILETENYIEFQESNIDAFNYLRIKNIGPGLITNCNVHICIETEERDQQINIEEAIPLILVNQEIFIIAMSIKLRQNPQLITSLEMNYKSITGEEIRYVYKVPKDKNENISEQYLIKNGDNYISIFGTTSKPVSWIFPAFKRNKSSE